MQRTLEQLKNGFSGFKKVAFDDDETLYTSLCEIITNSETLLKIADNVSLEQPFANILFGAVHLLLLKGYRSKLSKYYATIQQSKNVRLVDNNLESIFTNFVNHNYKEIVEICKIRRVQTNEIGRCSFILPGLNYVQTLTKKPLILIELGTSAGLLLNYDKYNIKYSEKLSIGDQNSPVTIQCDLKGQLTPPVFDLPKIKKKIGIDLQPIDCTDSEDSLWLQALIWPKNVQRLISLRKALEICRKNQSSFKFIRGDGFNDILTYIKDHNVLDSSLCIHHSFSMNQIPKPERENYYQNLKDYTKKSGNRIYELTIKWRDGEDPKYVLNEISEGKIVPTELAKVHHHGQWIEWLVN
ncbi:MAG: DUF2332 domain-containing protein [Promethearchaeota archaeon]